jgi:putative spermidine/putrescine transport system ATP-binding protein
MQLEIKRIHRELGATIIYVTHDQEEAMTMSDRICLMNAGAVAQLGSPDDLYFRPRSLFVADFLGESNLLPGTVREMDGEGLDIAMGGEALSAKAVGNGTPFSRGQSVRVMVRPQNLAVGAGAGPEADCLRGRIVDVMVSGSLTKLYMEPLNPGLPPLLVAAYPTRNGAKQHAIGEVLTLHWEPSDAVAIAHDSAAHAS